MKYKVLLKIWLGLSLSFIGLILVGISYALIQDWTIITKPLPTLIAISFAIPYSVLLVSGSILLDKLKKRELEIG